MQILHGLGSFATTAADRQHVLLDLDVEIAFGEARGRDDDAIVVITVLFDVVRGIRATGFAAQGSLEQIAETVEADRRTEQRGKSDSTHEIGRAHVCTPVTNANLVCRLLLEKKNT